MPIHPDPIHIGHRYQVMKRGTLQILDVATQAELASGLRTALELSPELAGNVAALLQAGNPVIAMSDWQVQLLGRLMLHPAAQVAVFSAPAPRRGRRTVSRVPVNQGDDQSSPLNPPERLSTVQSALQDAPLHETEPRD